MAGFSLPRSTSLKNVIWCFEPLQSQQYVFSFCKPKSDLLVHLYPHYKPRGVPRNLVINHLFSGRRGRNLLALPLPKSSPRALCFSV